MVGIRLKRFENVHALEQFDATWMYARGSLWRERETEKEKKRELWLATIICLRYLKTKSPQAELIIHERDWRF